VVDKQLKESSSSFDIKDRHITVSLVITDNVIAWRYPLLDKNGRPNVLTGMGNFGAHWNHVGPVIEPTKVVGVICPSEYVVTGLDVDLRFKLVRDEVNQRYGITELHVSGRDGASVTSNQLDTIPVGLLTRAAIKAGGVTGVLTALPDTPDMEYDQNQSLTLTSRGTLTDGEWIRIDGDTMVGKRRRVNTLTPEVLQSVANAYLNSSRGLRTDNVIRECGHMSTRTARRWIQQARDAGYLPPKLDADNGKDI
jgi:hypothetical protein